MPPMDAMDTHRRLEALKWVGLLTMVADHLGKSAWPESQGAAQVIGRVAMPLFALVVAARLAAQPALTTRYLRRLIPWALLAQPAFVWVTDAWVGNILFTLFDGALLWQAVQRAPIAPREATLMACLALALSPWLEYGPVGVLLVPTLAGAWQRSPTLACALCGPLALLANDLAPIEALVPSLGALAASPLALTLWWAAPRLPRAPRRLFYGFYPAHLYALGALTWWRFG